MTPPERDPDLAAIRSVLLDVRWAPNGIPRAIYVGRRGQRLVLFSTDRAAGFRLTTTFSGDPHDEANVLANLAQHAATSAASDAVATLTRNDAPIHDESIDGAPHVVIPPTLVDYRQDAARAVMLSKRRAREAHGGDWISTPHDADLDAMDRALSTITFSWPGSTIAGLWAERWSDIGSSDGNRKGRPGTGHLYIASESHRANLAGERRTDDDSRDRRMVDRGHPCTRFYGDPYNEEQVLAGAAHHLAWFAAHEVLEYASVGDSRLYDPHLAGEPEIRLPGLVAPYDEHRGPEPASDAK